MRNQAAPIHDFSLRARRRETENASGRLCEHGNCTNPALHRAPKRFGDRNARQWLCREHARERNLNWNYFLRMSTAEIDAARQAAIIWDRPTWPAAQATASFGKEGTARTCGRQMNGSDGTPAGMERSESRRRALAILGLQSAATPKDVRSRFRRLLRMLHPDLNAGRHVDATRLRAVIWAWRELQPANTARTQ